MKSTLKFILAVMTFMLAVKNFSSWKTLGQPRLAIGRLASISLSCSAVSNMDTVGASTAPKMKKMNLYATSDEDILAVLKGTILYILHTANFCPGYFEELNMNRTQPNSH